jgi:hypothetical protein
MDVKLLSAMLVKIMSSFPENGLVTLKSLIDIKVKSIYSFPMVVASRLRGKAIQPA